MENNDTVPVKELQNFLRALVAGKGWGTFKAASRADIPYSTMHRFLKQGQDLSTNNTIKLFHTLGFKLTLVKRRSRVADMFARLVGASAGDMVEITK